MIEFLLSVPFAQLFQYGAAFLAMALVVSMAGAGLVAVLADHDDE